MEIQVYLANFKNKTIEDIKSHYKVYLKDQDLQKAEKFKPLLNKKQSLISSSLKNKYINGIITYNEYGKPLSSEVYFNISHSNEQVVLAISKDTLVGVDIEYINKDISEDLINYTCNNEEKEFIKENKNKNFYYVWTRKEAILKCIGTGLVNDLKTIDGLNNNEYSLYSYFLDDYVFSIAFKKDNQERTIRIIKEKNYE